MLLKIALATALALVRGGKPIAIKMFVH